MLTLEALAPDLVESILSYLPADDIARLLDTGSRPLISKVLHKATCFACELLPGSKFPFSLLLLPNARSLRVTSRHPSYTILDLGDLSQLAERMSSKTLLSLHLTFFNALELFNDTDRPQSASSLCSQFPSLTSLVLESVHLTPEFVELISFLPKSLCTFDVSCESRTSTIPLKTISLLPRSLTVLKLWNCDIEAHKQSEIEYVGLLPPNLKVLALVTMHSPLILNHLPPHSLQSVIIWLRMIDEGFVWKASTLPPNLTHLGLQSKLSSIVLDAPLPHTLKEIVSTISTTSMNDLPRNLEMLPHYLCKSELVLDALQQFPKLASLTAWNEEHLERMTTHALRNLDLAEPSIRLSSPLPRSLTSLKICHPIHQDDIGFLPPNLKHLRVEMTKSREVAGSSPLPKPWSALTMLQLNFSSLTSLQMNVEAISEPNCLAALKTSFWLKTIHLSFVPHEWASIVDDWLPSCLPYRLKNLHLSPASSQPSEDALTTCDALSRCRLGLVVPHLADLDIDLYVSTERQIFGDFLASLPSKLNFLAFGHLCTAFETTALSNLPPVLVFLVIRFAPNATGSFVNEHFEGLPKNLASFSVYGPLDSLVDKRLFRMLPKTLADINLYIVPDPDLLMIEARMDSLLPPSFLLRNS